MAASKLIKSDNGSYVIVVSTDAEFSDFKSYGAKLKLKLAIEFKEKVDDFDTYYWVFSFLDSDFVLYYNIYEGIKIYLREEKDIKDSEKIYSLFKLLANE